MKRTMIAAALLLASTALATLPAKADLVFTTLGAGAVSQSQSNPCIICATNAQNPQNFGFNNFNSTGNDVAFNLFSSAITGQFANNDDVNVTPYTAGFLDSFLTGLGDLSLTFGVAIDINTAGGEKGNKETLTAFRLINLDGAGGNPEVVFNLDTGLNGIAMPKQNNGNGFADYLITGFDLTGIDAGDRLLFQATWNHATDGGESFYIVPRLVPAPAMAAGLPALLLAALGLFGLNRRRRNAVA